MAKKPKPKKPTYHDKLRTMFAEEGASFTLDEIAKRIGSDRRNAGVAISILRNPKRVKDPFLIIRDPETKKYWAPDNEEKISLPDGTRITKPPKKVKKA